MLFGRKKQLEELKKKKEQLDLAMTMYMSGKTDPETKERIILGQNELIEKMSTLLGM